ncbi:MAG: DUF4115 domain-containing protein [Gammaproteobacteria bacterium]|nr:DUF4115 domain-containing protein [Gammaproteobacteria bacterium]
MNQDRGEPSLLDAAEPENAAALAPGEQLKAARLAQGLSVADVSRRLKLPPSTIESLERSEVAGIAIPVFVTGYLRAYARLLELSADDVLEQFSALSAMSSPADAAEGGAFAGPESNPEGMIATALPSSTGTIFRPGRVELMSVLLGVLLIVLLVVAALYVAQTADERANEVVDEVANEAVDETVNETVDNALEQRSGDSQTESETGKESATEFAPPPGGVEPLSAADRESRPVTVPLSQASTMDMATPGGVAGAEADPATEAGPAGQGAEMDAVAEVFQQAELAIVFRDDSWVEVTDARGARLIYRLAKAGMSHTVTGAAPFEVQLGYVPGVEIFYNGVPYDLSRYAGRRSARFRVGGADEGNTNG